MGILPSRANCVAPYAGAWIETPTLLCSPCQKLVAPYAGAWIETNLTGNLTSDPLVAPYAGAWIETSLKTSWFLSM